MSSPRLCCCFLSFFLSTFPNPTHLHLFSLETVIYLNLRVGRESLNHQVLSADLNTEGGGSRTMPGFRGGGNLGDNNNSMSASPMDYKPIELDMDNEPTEALMPRMESV
jgi:hypothetical protein